MTAAGATVLAAVIAGVLALIVALVNVIAGRDGRRVDKAEKLTNTGLKLIDRIAEERDDCEQSLSIFRRALRGAAKALALCRPINPADQPVVDAAYAAAMEALDSP